MNDPHVGEAEVAPQATDPKRFSTLKQPRSLPIVGSLLAVSPTAAHVQFETWSRELGTPFRARLGRRYMMFIDDASDVSKVMKSRPGAFKRVRPLESVFREMGIAGVFSAEGADWERQRRLVMKAFDPAHLRSYFPSLLVVTERLMARFERAADANEVLDLQAEFMRYTVDVTAGLAFGADINTIDSVDNRIQKHLDKIFPAISRRMTSPWAYWRSFKLPSDRALDQDLHHVRQAIDGFIAAARARMLADPVLVDKPSNLIEALLAARDKPGSDFSDQDVSGNVFTALLAGEDTTANTLAWLCHFLCDDRDAQEALRAEALIAATDAAANATTGRVASLEALTSASAMPYTEAAVREAMRIKPVAPLLSHESNEPVVVAGISLRAGTPICTLLRAAGMDPEVFLDPQRFWPQRWLDDVSDAWLPNATSTRDQQSAAKKRLMPFGGGPRFCPGRYLAMLEIKLVIAEMSRRFVMTRQPGTQVTERYALSMLPEGLRVTLARRK